MVEYNYAGYENITDEALIEHVAKGIFTGILYGGSDEAWDNELTDGTDVFPVGYSRDWYRNGAIDAIRAYREYERAAQSDD